MRFHKIFAACAAMLTIAACQHSQPGIEVRTITVEKPVPQPCPGTVPTRPAKLAPLQPTAEAALAQVLAALAAYSAPGKYADQAESYFAACPPTTPKPATSGDKG